LIRMRQKGYAMNQEWLERIVSDARTFGLQLDGRQTARLGSFAQMMLAWNEKVNLTAITDDEGIAVRHFVDSLSALPLVAEGAAVVDVGTGAGFPGIPFAVARPDLSVTLLDSLEKRVRFLKAVTESLGLANVQIRHGRAEDFGREAGWRECFDVAVARAVASLPVLMEFCLPFVRVGGLFLAMKGPDIAGEASDSAKALRILGGRIADIRTFVLPGTDMSRNIVVVEKERPTPEAYPRKSGKPSREPLL
jgi:16S rRNA (guanine527-N7)-methyltransferase